MKCPLCEGSGTELVDWDDPGSRVRCWFCNGYGSVAFRKWLIGRRMVRIVERNWAKRRKETAEWRKRRGGFIA